VQLENTSARIEHACLGDTVGTRRLSLLSGAGRVGPRTGLSGGLTKIAAQRFSLPLFVQIIDLTRVDIRGGRTKPIRLTVFPTA